VVSPDVPWPVALVACALVATPLVWGRGRRVVAAALRDRSWPGVALLSAGALAGHVGMFLLAARLAGSVAPVSRLAPLAVVALLVMAVPVSVGGWGPREAVSTLVFGAAGLGGAQGLATAVVYGTLALVAALPGAAVLVAGLVRSSPARWARGNRPATRRTRPA
jgi:glycosyltransferase 2 family protein